MLDHYGLLGNPKAVASPLRLLGGALMIAGVMVIVYAKHSEARQTPHLSASAATEKAE